MSDLTLNQNARMTDSLERDMLRGAMESQPVPTLWRRSSVLPPVSAAASPPSLPSSMKSTNP